MAGRPPGKAVGEAVSGRGDPEELWWDDHPNVPAEQLTERVVALILRGLRAMSEPA
jgi:hypothetical protein